MEYAQKRVPLSCNKDYKFMNLLHDYQTSSKVHSLHATLNALRIDRRQPKVVEHKGKFKMLRSNIGRIRVVSVIFFSISTLYVASLRMIEETYEKLDYNLISFINVCVMPYPPAGSVSTEKATPASQIVKSWAENNFQKSFQICKKNPEKLTEKFKCVFDFMNEQQENRHLREDRM